MSGCLDWYVDCELLPICGINWSASFVQLSRVFAIGPGDRSSIPGWVIPKTQKMVLDAALLGTQRYEVMIKGKVGVIQGME